MAVARTRILLLLACALLAACQPAVALPQAPTPRPTFTPFAFSSLYGLQVATYTPTPAPTATATLPPVFSGEHIDLTLFCALSGPLPELAAGRQAAFEAAIAGYNAAGGVHGAQLLVRVVDSAQAELELQPALDGAVLAVFCDAASEAALSERLRQLRVPVIGLGVFDPPGGRLQALAPPPSQALDAWLDFISSEWGRLRPTNASQPRLAVLSWPEALAGPAVSAQLAATPQEQDALLLRHSELAPELTLNVYDTLYALRDDNTNVLFVNADSFGLASVLNALHHLGLRSRVLVAAPAAAYEPVLYTYLADPAFADGLYILSAYEYSGEWQQVHMQAAAERAVAALETILGDGDDFGLLTPAAVLQALAAQPGPAALRVWRVGASPGELTPQN